MLDFLLYLNGFGCLVAEALDKLTHISYLFLLILISSQLLFSTFLAKGDIFVILHLVVNDTTARNLERTIRHIIDKCTVVTNQHHSLSALRQELFQPLYRLNIQMVRRLVEQQHIRFLQKNLGQFNTHAPTSTELASRTLEV